MWLRIKQRVSGGSLVRSKKALVAIVLLAVIGLAFAQFVVRPHVRRWRAQIQEVPLAGASVAYRDIGHGSPSVVIINGMSCTMGGYHELQDALAGTTRVLNYDRPGLGESGANSEPRTLDVIDKDLKNLLELLKVPPPYVMIGHSLGGHIIRYYAHKHPGEVTAFVFLDAPHEDWFRYIRSTWAKDEVEEYFKWWSLPSDEYQGAALEEKLTYEKNCDLIRGIGVPPNVHTLMFTGNNYGHFRKTSPGREEDRKKWAEMQASVLTGVKDGKQIVDFGAGHMFHKDRPKLVADELKKLIERLRTEKAARTEADGR
jgi:pimeloyl-ACP methyl ester carboxylesterase